MELFLPEEYPMAPPKVRFLTKIYHPNIGVLDLSHKIDPCKLMPSQRQTRADMSGYLERLVCNFPNGRYWDPNRSLQTNGRLPCRSEPFYCPYKPCSAHQILMTLSPPMLQNITRKMRRMLNGLAWSGLELTPFKMIEPAIS